ncbi:MAG: hypothetical protein M0P61_05520 [Ignavibacteriaceae bacterium]|jgi:hypothetical protein|nr:hypothetical protein [Ignavibacteriaceae bacterium]
MKKLIISILIPSLLLSLYGCYTTNEISKDEYIKLGPNREIIKPDPELETCLITNDSTRYNVSEFSYNDSQDTITILQGAISIKKLWKGAKWQMKESLTPFSGKIAVADVKNFEVKAKNERLMTIVYAASLVGIAILLYAILTTDVQEVKLKIPWSHI